METRDKVSTFIVLAELFQKATPVSQQSLHRRYNPVAEPGAPAEKPRYRNVTWPKCPENVLTSMFF
jgi:hypothetical protein